MRAALSAHLILLDLITLTTFGEERKLCNSSATLYFATTFLNIPHILRVSSSVSQLVNLWVGRSLNLQVSQLASQLKSLIIKE